MARPLRIELAGGVYHLTSRGDRREPIYADDVDRLLWLELFGEVCDRFNWRCHAWCQMGNHYHLVVETAEANLSRGMRQLNGVYTQAANRRHARVGHVFQGRYKAILVDSDSYLLELTRYVVLNPVRARMVKAPEAWPWTSYRAMTGDVEAPSWLETDELLAQFGSHRSRAATAYQRFVHEGIDGESIWKHLNRQVFLGDDAFVTRSHRRATVRSDDLNIPRAQRRPPAPSLQAIAKSHPDRDKAIRAAWSTGEYSYTQIAAHFGVHFTTVGRIVRRSI